MKKIALRVKCRIATMIPTSRKICEGPVRYVGSLSFVEEPTIVILFMLQPVATLLVGLAESMVVELTYGILGLMDTGDGWIRQR